MLYQYKVLKTQFRSMVYLIKLRSRKYSYFVIASAVNCLDMLGKPKLTAFQAIDILFFSLIIFLVLSLFNFVQNDVLFVSPA